MRDLIGIGVALASLACVPAASAATPAPGFLLYAHPTPTMFSPEHPVPEGGSDAYSMGFVNSGSEPTDGPITLRDELPPGVEPVAMVGDLASYDEPDGVEPEEAVCDITSTSCTYNHVLLPGEEVNFLLDVKVRPGTVGPVTNSVSVSGGGAPTVTQNVITAIGTAAESSEVPFGINSLSASVFGVDGQTDEQAGDHSYGSNVTFIMNTINAYKIRSKEESAGGLRHFPGGTKDTVVVFPPGFAGDPDVVERCPQYDVQRNACAPDTQIGVARLVVIDESTDPSALNGGASFPVYNVEPEKGYPAQFEIDLYPLNVRIPLFVTVTPETDYSVKITTPDISEFGTPIEVSVSFFGTPLTNTDPYNEYRDEVKEGAPVAFLDDPVDCSAGPQSVTLYADSWENPGPLLPDGEPDLSNPRWVSKSTTIVPSLLGCELLQFNPSLTVTPSTTRADEPAGTTVNITVPQALQQYPELVTPEFKNSTVTLPSGLSISPSAGDGLEGCSNAQIALSTAGLGTCPTGSQIGTIRVVSPLLPQTFEGQVYLGTPHCNPCTTADASDGNMYRIFLQVEGPGVVLKQEGTLYTNPTTGQLTTVLRNTPQLPLSHVELHFNGGLRAALATPQVCGTAASSADLTPYSSPITPDATPQSQFTVDWNGSGEACPSVMPFHPEFEAGTANPNAGQLTPLTVTFNREDREQNIAALKITTPPGLLGFLTGLPLCQEPQADLGTCSAASQIGELTVAAGPGSHPYYQKGVVYLTGPYNGAPFGLSIVVPTHAGPFNLGNIVVRGKINIDPYTTALTVTTNPLPQILDGIPLRLRKTNVTINRPGFIFNPTDCAELHIDAQISGAQGAVAETSTRFAVAGCAGLSFGPKFVVSTEGKTSKADGASLNAKVLFPSGPQSNIAHVKVELPKALPSRLSTLQKSCPNSVFEANPAACPAASVIGAVKVATPILPVKLIGPMYFVSHGGLAFPNLVAVLQGYGVRVNLVGETYISPQGITSSTFTNIPDVPVGSFELFLPEGPFSALAANGNLCKEKLVMPTLFTAQDGAVFKQKTPILATGCPKATAKKASKAKKAKKAKKASRARSAGRRHSTHGRSR
jgi:hypothetical protein